VTDGVLVCAIALFAAFIITAEFASCQKTDPIPQKIELTGDLGAHDPVIIREGNKWHIYYTGVGIEHKVSDDLQRWQDSKSVFYQKPAWFSEYVPRVRESIWAPDIFFYSGKYYLYYSVSMFGKNNSVVGLASNKTLDPDSADYKWEDLGAVISSTE